MAEPAKPRVGLLVTCLVDLIRPSVGFATVKLLEQAGCIVEVPTQSCCGQPAFNSGDRKTARELAEQAIVAFESYDYIVAPSGSCAGQARVHYPELFQGDPNWQPRADAFAAKTYELTQFLVNVRSMTRVEARLDGVAAYHDSCSSLRECGVQEEPRRLLASVQGLTVAEMEDREACCGFGGTFCVKYPDISNVMVTKKAANAAATGADLLLGGDLGCLMNIAGKLAREGKPIAVRHVAEALAGELDSPPIGVAEMAQAPTSSAEAAR